MKIFYDNLGAWRQLGVVAPLSHRWLRLSEKSIYPAPLLRITPLFDVKKFQGFFWIRFEDSLSVPNSVTRSERYYPEYDGQSTLLQLETPPFFLQFAEWVKTCEVMYIPQRGSALDAPPLKVEETQ